jgi:hypothetical protein
LSLKVCEAYLPLRRTWARHVPCFVLTVVPMTRAVPSIRAKSVHTEIKRGTNPCTPIHFRALLFFF